MAKINDEGFLELSGVNESPFKGALDAQKFPVLQGLTPLSLRVLNNASHTIHVSQDVELLRTGDMSHDVYFILQGSVSIRKDEKGGPKEVAKVMAGDFYGEYAAIKAKPRFISVYTSEPSKIIRIDAKVLLQVFESDPVFKDRMYDVMKKRSLKTFLSCSPMFQSLNASMCDMLSEKLQTMELERGSTLFGAGDDAKNYYLIISGEAEISVGSEGYSTVLEIRRVNHVLGEVRGNKGATYAYSVWAANSLDLLVLDKVAMQSIQQASDKVIPLLNAFMSKSAKKTSAMIQQARKENA